MNATININLEESLTKEERATFEANARLAGRKPGEHLRSILFGGKTVKTRKPRKGGRK